MSGKQDLLVWTTDAGTKCEDTQCFSIITKTRAIHLEAPSADQVQRWLMSIHHILTTQAGKTIVAETEEQPQHHRRISTYVSPQSEISEMAEVLMGCYVSYGC